MAVLMTIGDAARTLGLSISTTRDLASAGRLRGRRTVQGIRVFTEAAVLRCKAQRAERLALRQARRAQKKAPPRRARDRRPGTDRDVM
jgi:DNA-binding transcriptional MerR regulator